MISLYLSFYSPKNYKARSVFAMLPSLFLALSAFAQGDSSLCGKVTDATDAQVSGATLVIKNLETDTERRLVTDEAGLFNAAALPVGQYEITSAKNGFQTARRRATFGFSRGAFFFDSNTTTDLPGWIHGDQRVGAVVVGGGTTLNGASQITNGGTNAGSNLSAVRNLFTADDQLTITRGKHLLTFGGWVQRIQANDTLIQDQYGQASFTNLRSFLHGKVGTYTYALAFSHLGWCLHLFEIAR